MLRIREKDEALIEGLIGSVSADYKQMSGKDIKLKIDKDNFLPAETTGGIELTAQRGKIKITNTLESRLDLISSQLIPEIRIALFGRNPNRKFND